MVSKAKQHEKEGARQQIERLFGLATEVAPKEQALADRYVFLARKLASRNRVSLRKYNRVHCRKCSAYFTAKTVRVRTRPAHIVYACLKCGNITRIRK